MAKSRTTITIDRKEVEFAMKEWIASKYGETPEEMTFLVGSHIEGYMMGEYEVHTFDGVQFVINSELVPKK